MSVLDYIRTSLEILYTFKFITGFNPVNFIYGTQLVLKKKNSYYSNITIALTSWEIPNPYCFLIKYYKYWFKTDDFLKSLNIKISFAERESTENKRSKSPDTQFYL